jgi:YfdX protein
MKPISRLLSTVAALAAINMTTASCARSDPPKENRQTVAPAATAIDNPRAQRSEAAIKVLAGVEQARDAIRRGDRPGATTHIDAALAMLRGIDSMPLVPIYSELSEASALGPVIAAKGGAGQAGGATAATESPASANANASASLPPVAVKTVATAYSRVLLDTSVTKRQLDAARTALAAGNSQAADKALQQVQQAVVVESSAARLPLVRARENLALASAAVMRSDWTAAKAQLNAAANAIADDQKVAPVGQVADLKMLQQQISSYAGMMDKQHADAGAKIQGWWSRVADLTDQPA